MYIYGAFDIQIVNQNPVKMKKLLFKLFALFLVLTIVQSCNEPLINEQPTNEIALKSANTAKKSYIVVVNDSELNTELTKLKGYEKKQQAVKSTSAKILKRAGIADGEVEHVYGTALKGFSVKIAPGQLKKLQNDPAVVSIEEDQIVSLIQPYRGNPHKGGGGGGGGSTPPPQETPWGITRVHGGVSEVPSGTAWIIDTGIDLDHPDLNVDATGSNKSFLSGKHSTPDDQNGHGTHVAGTIAAIDNNIGVIGVAAGARVVSVRVLDRRGSGSTSGVIAGVDYVAANGSPGDVANMSLGGGVSASLDKAVIDAAATGVIFTLAAGNESDNANNHSPARVNGNNIYTISAMDKDDNWASWSNYGNPPIDYCAPGVNIKSTWKDGGYNTESGTSMAAPHVAGILLLGSVKSDGTVNGDPDGNPDPIAVH